MAIIASDLHCNVDKVKKFLEYKPEELHIFAGDILDSFKYSFDTAIKSLNLLLESDCILLWGNHDIGYRAKKPFNCSGYQWKDAPIFTKVIEDSISRFQHAYEVDDYLITHAGVNTKLDKFDDAEHEAAYLNTEPKGIFDIGMCRGGYQAVGGTLWFDFRSETLSEKYNQVFGHCCLREPMSKVVKGKHIVCINTREDEPELYIFDTTKREVIRIDE